MAVSIKDSLRFVGIIIMVACAVLVCNMFLNYDFDLHAIESAVEGEAMRTLYDALLTNNKVVCMVSGLCLALTSVVMLVFYIGHYIETHSARFGILKALGYTDFKIAVKCAVFGFCVLVGALIGFALSWAIMPAFYRAQNSDEVDLPQVVLNFHIVLPICLVLLPSVIFAVLSVGIAWVKLRKPALSLIKGEVKERKLPKIKEKKSDKPFLRELAFNLLGERKLLAFFIAFGCFCFSAMTQMGVSMRDYASDMMGIMILIIGLILAAISLWLALTSVINGNAKKIAMLKVHGYSFKECGLSVLALYHIPALIGFAVGSVYQWALLYIMVNFVFGSFDNVPVYSFDWVAFGICLAAFFVVYELLNVVYSVIISKTSVKSVMGE